MPTHAEVLAALRAAKDAGRITVTEFALEVAALDARQQRAEGSQPSSPRQMAGADTAAADET